MAKRSKKAGIHHKLALVTGASAGIGEAFAERLAADGYDLLLVARAQDRLDAIAERLEQKHGVSARVLAADLTDHEQRAEVESALREATPDLLVNNAGFGTVGRFAESDAAAEEREVMLNVVALSQLTRAVLPGMIARRSGSVINVSSMAAFQAAPYNATYAATKAFVNSFTESLAEELADTGIVVQALCPGFTRTEFQERAGINVTGIPDMAWMSAADVVDASLAGLARGELVCIPGFSNRALTTLTAFLPRSWTRKLVGRMAEQMLD